MWCEPSNPEQHQPTTDGTITPSTTTLKTHSATPTTEPVETGGSTKFEQSKPTEMAHLNTGMHGFHYYMYIRLYIL